MKVIYMILVVVWVMAAAVSCARLDGYRRTYSLNVMGAQGQAVGLGLTLDPVRRSGK